MIWRTRFLGLSDPWGSWNTICMCLRYGRMAREPSEVMSAPRKRTLPAVGRNSRTAQRASVVFPHPDSPTSPSVSPSAKTKLTSSTACT